MESGSDNDHARQQSCFQEWLNVQHQDLSELQQAKTINPDNPTHHAELSQLVQKNLQHYQDYAERRSQLAQADASAFFTPEWCTSLENSLLWIAGCRPSIFIRLVYAHCSADLESSFAAFLTGDATTGKLSELSASQLTQVNALQMKTVKEEEELTSRLASLQEDIVDEPLVGVARAASEACESSRESDEALDDHGESMANLLLEADQMRLRILKELMGILTPAQGVEYLVASKKIHLCVREWGRKRDLNHGRN